MNLSQKIALIILLSPFISLAYPSKEILYERLYYTCKAWGHFKYYHTEVASGKVNWDDVLLSNLDGIKEATTNEAFNHSLELMLQSAGDMGTNTKNKPNIPDSLNNINDFSWISNDIFSDQVKASLDSIRSRFSSQSNYYVNLGYAGNPTFDLDTLYYAESTYPDENKRILALFRYWNIINYFFPYKDIMDQDWDSTLVEFIPQIAEAPNETAYHLAFKRLTTHINDSHAFFNSPTYYAWQGTHHPPFLARYIENEMVITKVLPDITEVSPGDIIKAIDGVSMDQLRDSLRIYAQGSNDVILEREINKLIKFGDYGSFSITVDNGFETVTTSLIRNAFNYESLWDHSNPSWRNTTVNGKKFGIVDIETLKKDEVKDMFNDLWQTDAIIFDVRNYPLGTLWTIVDYLFPTSIRMANFTVPDITYPGRFSWVEPSIGTGTTTPYSGHVIMLFDERTQSQAEYTCMGLEQFPNAIKIGSTTSGADGNVSYIYLPGRIRTAATFLGVFYPDYTPTQRIGIIPDIEIYPTIEGIRAGEDEVLDYALNLDLDDLVGSKILLFPNPSPDKIKYEITNYHDAIIELYDLKGNKLKTIKTVLDSGTIDISNLNHGLYIVKTIFNRKTETQLITKK